MLESGQYSKSTVGAPQGGVISLLLSNIYLNYFDIYWKKHFGHLGELVRYADDFVILCKRKAQAEEALRTVKWIMKKLELTLHSEKTRLVDMYFGKTVLIFLVSTIDFCGSGTKTGNGIGRYSRYHRKRL